MRRHLLLLALAATLALVAACSDDDTATDGAAGTSTTAAGAASDGTAAPSSGTGDEAAMCADVAVEAAPDLAATTFPDNPDVTWTVAAVETDDEGLALVEVVPEPDEVGYPAFRLAVTCESGEAVHLGTYALDGGSWVLLATTDAPGADELEPTLS